MELQVLPHGSILAQHFFLFNLVKPQAIIRSIA
jgi:hypothetical protein